MNEPVASSAPIVDITPKTKKIRNLRVKVSKLRRRISDMHNTGNKITVSALTEHLKEKLSYNQFTFIQSQLRHCKKSSYGRRWTSADKSLAVNIYLKSPSAYRMLRRHIVLPTIKTLRQLISGIGNFPGFCPSLLENLKQTARKMNIHNKMCILCFDEMSIKSGLQYNQHLDWISGYECFGINDNPSDKFATSALVFMIRGLSKHWKQPIGYFFSHSSTPAVILKKLLFEAFDHIEEAGLRLVAITCDQGVNNQRLYSMLNVSESSPFVQHKGHKIFTLFDTPHLLKSVRNNLKKYKVIFENQKMAQWRHIEEFFTIDSAQKYCVAPRLTKAHMETSGLSSMHVNLAAQILNHSVAAGICLLTATGQLPPSATFTSDFVGQMDELFDSFNSRSEFNAKRYASAVTNNSNHIEMWKSKLKWIKSWQFKKHDNKNITPACKKGWLLTINTTIQLWEYLQKEGQQFLLTNRLNQDCLENSFSSIRRMGGFRDNPDCAQFESAMRSVMTHNLLKSSSLSNCEDDTDDILATVLISENNFGNNTLISR